MKATQFQENVWRLLLQIPKGRVSTYGAIARHLQCRSARAVGNAIGANVDAPRIPCHRVVRADGSLGGYSAPGGVARKQQLLEFEGIRIRAGRVEGLAALHFEDFVL